MVALGGLAALLLGLLALLAAYSIDWLIHRIAEGLGDYKVGPFKINLGGIFSSAVNPILGFCIEHGAALFDNVGHWIIDHAYVMDEGFKEAAAAISHLSDQIVHIATSELPTTANQARKDAEEWASKITHNVRVDVSHGANRAIDAFHAGSYAGLIHAFEAGKTVTEAIGAAAASAAHYADGQIHSAIHTLHSILSHDIQVAETEARNYTASVERILTEHIQSLTRTVASDYRSAIATAAADAAGALSSAKHYTDAVENILTEHIQALAAATAAGIKGAIEDAAKDAAEALTAANAGLHTAVEGIDGKIVELTNTVGTDLTTAEHFAEAKAAEVLGTATTALHAAVEGIDGTIGALEGTVATGLAYDAELAANDAAEALAGATATVGGALAGVTSDITKEAAAYAGDLTATEGMTAAAITGAIAAVATRVARLEECSVTTCEGPNQLGGLLESLWQLGGLAALGAYIGEAIEHPKPTGEAWAAEADTLYQGAESLLDALTSI